MHSKLFDSIIHDDLASQPFDEFDGVGTPLLHEFCEFERIFEQVLSEANESNFVYRKDDGTPNEDFPFVGLFPPQILDNRNLQSVIEPQLFVSGVYIKYALDQKFKDYLFLPCNKTHQIPIEDSQEMQKMSNFIKTTMINAEENIKHGISKSIKPDEIEERFRNNFNYENQKAVGKTAKN